MFPIGTSKAVNLDKKIRRFTSFNTYGATSFITLVFLRNKGCHDNYTSVKVKSSAASNGVYLGHVVVGHLGVPG